MRPDTDLYHSIVTPTLRAIAAFVFLLFAGQAALSQDADLNDLFAQLARPDNEGWRIAESDILREWSKSGSAAMDLLLKRGQEAFDNGDIDSAIGHLTALTDHAPDFAAGWQARGSAYAAAGYFGPAIADLAQALALEPRQFVAMTQLGVLLEETGNYDAAEKAYRESLKIHPHQQEATDGVARLEKLREGTDI